VLRIEGMGYFDPGYRDLLMEGQQPGARMQLWQHVQQLNVALRACQSGGKEAPAIAWFSSDRRRLEKQESLRRRKH